MDLSTYTIKNLQKKSLPYYIINQYLINEFPFIIYLVFFFIPLFRYFVFLLKNNMFPNVKMKDEIWKMKKLLRRRTLTGSGGKWNHELKSTPKNTNVLSLSLFPRAFRKIPDWPLRGRPAPRRIHRRRVVPTPQRNLSIQSRVSGIVSHRPSHSGHYSDTEGAHSWGFFSALRKPPISVRIEPITTHAK